MSESPLLPPSVVAMEKQRNALDGFPSLKYRSSHKLSHDFVEDSDKRKSFPSTFHQVYPSNRDSNRISENSYGYVPFRPAPTPDRDTVPPGGHYEVVRPNLNSNSIYCNMPFQSEEPSFVPLTRHNMAPSSSLDSLDYIQDTNVPHRPPSRHNHATSPDTSPTEDTFQPVRFISMGEDKSHTSLRSLATPVSTRLFISTTPLDPEMASLSSSQDCLYDSDRATQRRCIRMLSQSMNLNPDVTTWVIPSAREKRRSMASLGHSSVGQSEESLEPPQPPQRPERGQRRERVLGRILGGIVGLFRSRPKGRSQSDRRAEKRKLKIGLIEHPSPFSPPHPLSPLSQPSYPQVPYSMPLMPSHVPLVPSHTPHRTQTPVFRELATPNTLPSDRKLSVVSRPETQFVRQLSSQSSQSNSPQESATSQVAHRRHNPPAPISLSPDCLYENLPCHRSPLAAKPPLPLVTSIYSNMEEMAQSMPPLKSRTPEPVKQRSCDSKNRTQFPDSVPYAGLRKAVAKEEAVARRQRNAKNAVRNVGSTPNIISPAHIDKVPDHLPRHPAREEVSTGPTHRKASVPSQSTNGFAAPKPARFSSVETLC